MFQSTYTYNYYIALPAAFYYLPLIHHAIIPPIQSIYLLFRPSGTTYWVNVEPSPSTHFRLEAGAGPLLQLDSVLPNGVDLSRFPVSNVEFVNFLVEQKVASRLECLLDDRDCLSSSSKFRHSSTRVPVSRHPPLSVVNHPDCFVFSAMGV